MPIQRGVASIAIQRNKQIPRGVVSVATQKGVASIPIQRGVANMPIQDGRRERNDPKRVTSIAIQIGSDGASITIQEGVASLPIHIGV